MKPSRPILRYYGGKWLLAPWILAHFPSHRIYTEAYGGAGSVLIRKRRVYCEVLNDLNGDVVQVFRILRDPEQAAELARRLHLTPYARDEWKEAYQPPVDEVDRARKTICRSFMGFGSDSVLANRKTGFRTNSNRSGTAACTDWSRYPAEIPAFVDRIRGIVIDSKPALEVLLEHDTRETLHYVDPPYVHRTRSEVRGYSHEMTDSDHCRLSEVLSGLAGYVVLSGYRCALYDGLYAGWERVDRAVTVFRQTPRVESLWLSPRTSRALNESGLFRAESTLC